jgi:hypothetical protein
MVEKVYGKTLSLLKVTLVLNKPAFSYKARESITSISTEGLPHIGEAFAPEPIKKQADRLVVHLLAGIDLNPCFFFYILSSN